MDAARQKLNIPQDQIIPITFAITDSEYMQKKALKYPDFLETYDIFNLLPLNIGA